MSITDGSGGPAHGLGAGAPVARVTRAWAAGLLLTIVAIQGVPVPLAMAQSGSPDASPTAPSVKLIASGPFGKVAGLELPTGAGSPDLGSLDILDAWGRGVAITFAPDAGVLSDWHVTATREPLDGTRTAASLPTILGRPIVRMPASGVFLIRFDGTVTQTGGVPGVTAGSWSWRIAVPDRDVPSNGDPYPPVPAIVLRSADHAIEMDQGSGCFVGTCGDIGATPPPGTLPTIRAMAGVPLE